MTRFTVETLPPLNITMDALIHRHGQLQVFAAAVAGLTRAATIRRSLTEMPDHLRRDIGLPPIAGPSAERERIR